MGFVFFRPRIPNPYFPAQRGLSKQVGDVCYAGKQLGKHALELKFIHMLEIPLPVWRFTGVMPASDSLAGMGLPNAKITNSKIWGTHPSQWWQPLGGHLSQWWLKKHSWPNPRNPKHMREFYKPLYVYINKYIRIYSHFLEAGPSVMGPSSGQ